MSWIDAEEVRDYIECIDYFDNGGENELADDELEHVAKKATEYLMEQLNGNDWFNSMVDACISDALACR